LQNKGKTPIVKIVLTTRISKQRKVSHGKEGCLAMARALAGLQNEELEAGYSANSSL